MIRIKQMEMNKNIIKVPQLAWQGVRDLELLFPERWKVEMCNMQGYHRKALTSSEIKKAVQNPLGTEPIRKLAKNKKQVVIIFDDITRATRVAQIVPFVLEELAKAGIADDCIRFVAATGTHAPMTRFDFLNKLGEDVLRRFPVYNHNAFACCVDIGTTSYGTRLLVNAEVMSCDFKIGIGSVVPHSFAGFGGGAKIIIPGICYFETCIALHQLGAKHNRENPDTPIKLGTYENNVLRSNMDEAAEMVELDIKIDTLMNSYGETVAVYAGKPKFSYPQALDDARNHYNTVMSRDNDIVIANTFAKVAECECGLEIARPSLREEGGEIVLICNAPQGHVTHYLASPWGKTSRSKTQKQRDLGPEVKRLIIYNEYPDLTISGFFAPPEKVVFLSYWEDVLTLLKKSHSIEAKVAVYPAADIQYCLT